MKSLIKVFYSIIVSIIFILFSCSENGKDEVKSMLSTTSTPSPETSIFEPGCLFQGGTVTTTTVHVKPDIPTIIDPAIIGDCEVTVEYQVGVRDVGTPKLPKYEFQYFKCQIQIPPTPECDALNAYLSSLTEEELEDKMQAIYDYVCPKGVVVDMKERLLINNVTCPDHYSRVELVELKCWGLCVQKVCIESLKKGDNAQMGLRGSSSGYCYYVGERIACGTACCKLKADFCLSDGEVQISNTLRTEIGNCSSSGNVHCIDPKTGKENPKDIPCNSGCQERDFSI